MCVVMEILKGGDLFTYLERKKFRIPEARACKIIHSLATSLFYIHSYGITHRDLKPENVLMVDETDSSDVKLVDFGLSKIIGKFFFLELSILGPNETCNDPFGTLSYVAPEVLLQQPYAKTVDIWSLGKTCLRIIFSVIKVWLPIFYSVELFLSMMMTIEKLQGK